MYSMKTKNIHYNNSFFKNGYTKTINECTVNNPIYTTSDVK